MDQHFPRHWADARDTIPELMSKAVATRHGSANGIRSHHGVDALEAIAPEVALARDKSYFSSNGKAPRLATRPSASAKFLYVGKEKLFVRGVTYGTFQPDASGNEFHDPQVVARDFKAMAANGINTIRTYTVPPGWLLDLAHDHGLYVIVGLPWEQHITFLDDKKRVHSIIERVRHGVRACAPHPAILCYALGNEIPAAIVRWHGPRRVERFLEQLYRAAKSEDAKALVTYVNYPSTEYLQLPFLDLVCFNVYLETQERLQSYLARLQNIAGDRPLLMTEIGLDSRRNGMEKQARALDWQVRTVFASGCAGAVVFAWTDEWHRGGHNIDDWDFGLVDRERQAKPALAAVREAFAETPFLPDMNWPRISVVVCSYNGSRTIRECCEDLQRLRYPNYEVIIINDGSTDATPKIVSEFGYRLINTANMGLSHARNLGMEAATGEIVAYLDDDAYPDPHWLTYLAAAFMKTKHVGIGGPNVTIKADGWVAECIGNSPGNPTHVLLTDEEAEHIPGCNMAFRKEALETIGGFDAQFRVAGDDVDVCWRLQQRGWTLGFSPAAMVWHHRRNSVKTYWRQQLNYGKAEALLEMKWPEKYNRLGHSRWQGRMYGNGNLPPRPFRPWRIYYGIWGSSLFQSLYERAPSSWSAIPAMPEWYLIVAALAAFSLFGVFWSPLLFALPLFLAAAGLALLQAGMNAAHASRKSADSYSFFQQLRRYLLTMLLHLLQPLARLCGRMRYGLAPWRRRGKDAFAFPWPRTAAIWSERWRSLEMKLYALEAYLRSQGIVVMRGGNFDRWDVEVRGGIFGTVRLRMVIEEHGAGKQLVRLKSWPRFSRLAIALISFLASLASVAMLERVAPAAFTLAALAGLLAVRTFGDCAAATSSCLCAVTQLQNEENGCPVRSV